MNGEQQTFYSDNDSVLRKILEESPASNTTFSTITDLASDDSHKHNRVKATKTSHKRKHRKDKDKDKDKDGKLYPVGPREVARLLLKDEYQAQQMKRIFEQTAERLDIESKRAIEAERRAHEAEDRMLQMLDTTRDAQRELLREREMLRAYQAQVDAAKSEILKAQKELDTLAEEKYKVEQEAAQERSRYRQLHKEVEVKEALNRGRLEGFMDGRKEGWQLGKDYARGKVRVWRDAEYYSEGEETASLLTTTDAPEPPPLGYRPRLNPQGGGGGQTQTGQAPVSMPVPDIRSDLPGKHLPRTVTPHGNRRAVSAMQSPKSRTSGKSHRKNSTVTVTMPIPYPAPAAGPGPSGLRQNTLSTEDDGSIKSPRVYSTKTPLRPPSVRAPSTRPDTAARARTPVNEFPTPTSPLPAQSSQPSQSVPSFEQPQSTSGLPPIRPIPSPQPRSPSHSPINPLPGGFIPVLEEGRISLPPPHEVDPFPHSPSVSQNRSFEPIGQQHQHQHPQQPVPPTVNVTVNAYSVPPVGQSEQIPEGNTFNFPVPHHAPDPSPPPAREFTIPVPDIAPLRQSPAQFNRSPYIPQNSPSRRSPQMARRSPSRTPVGNFTHSPVGTLDEEFDGLDLASELFEPDENGNIPGTIGYVPPRGSTWRPLSAIPEGGSTAAESPAPERIMSKNPSAASFRNQVPKFPQFPGGGSMFKPHPPIPTGSRSPSMGGHSPISPHSPLPNLELMDERGILNDPREYADFDTDMSNNFVTPSRQQLAEHLRHAPEFEQIRDDVSIRTSSTRHGGRGRIRKPTDNVAFLEKQAVLYDNFGSGRPYPGFNSSESSGDLAPTPQASRTPFGRTPGVPQVTLMEPSPSPPNRPASRASSRRNSITSIHSLDPPSPSGGANIPFIPPSPSQFQNPGIQHDFRIVKNFPAASVASQSRMPTVGRMPVNLPDRTPGFGNHAFPGATPARFNQQFSVASTVRNLAGGTQGGGGGGAPSVRATPARPPLNMNSSTTTIRRLPATLPSRGTGRTIPSELPRLSMNFDSGAPPNAPAGFVPQASPAMFNVSSGISAATPRMGGGGTFMGRTPANPMGGLPPNESISHPGPGFVPQPPSMSANTPHMGGGTFMGRTPANAMGGLPQESMSHPGPGFVPQSSAMSANTPHLGGGTFMGRTPANAMGGLPQESMSHPGPGFVPQPSANTPHLGGGTFMGTNVMGGLPQESHPSPGYIPQPPTMSANTPHMGGGGGTFMGRTPANAMGGLPINTPASANVNFSNVSNAANFKTGSAREPVTHTNTKEPARLPGSRRPSFSASSTGRMPARLPSFTGGGESSQQQQQQQAQAQPFPGFSQYDFGFGSQPFGGGGPFGGGAGSFDNNAFRVTPASAMRNMSNVRAPARLPGHSSTNAPTRLPDRNSMINTPARLPLPPSANTPWSMGPPLTNSRPPTNLPTPGSSHQPFIPPSPHTSAAPTPGRMGAGLPTAGGFRAGSQGGSPARSSSPYRKFDPTTYVDPSTIPFPPSRPSSRAGSVRSSQGAMRPESAHYLVPPGGRVTEWARPTIESASDEED